MLYTTGKPLDVVMSYSHLNVQNRTLEAFRPAFLERARVGQVVAASPFSMGLLGHRTPWWHPASDAIKEAASRAIAAADEVTGTGTGTGSGSGLVDPATGDLVLGYAFERAREAGIPTVVGLSTIEEVHTCARVWHQVEHGKASREWAPKIAAMVDHFRRSDVLDLSWENPKLS